ncbi:hypothetical protein [Amycolatopsis sp. CFH S0078]|uniref:hypothetical protein n=1 Tax=Amycolatopsis sp. CFH S0078 TaxID=1644108 RepID=UPI00106EB5E2|nr:hypothetical protein [Amycolatopsis sp. CFH S0078]
MSIVDGTWGSGAAPEEFVAWLLMRKMHWSWEEYERTPPYVRRFCFDFLQLQFEEKQRQMEAQHGG